jgi:hypothetical protein
MSKDKTANNVGSTTKTEPRKVPPSSGPLSPGTSGCATSFLNQEKNELDKACGTVPPNPKEEYVQKDDEKESGGEA